MNGNQKIIKVLKNATSFSDMYKAGFTPDDIKKCIIDVFDVFFERKDRLYENSTNFLVSDWISISKHLDDSWFMDQLMKCLQTYRMAKLLNTRDCFNVIQELLDSHLESGNCFWRMVLLETNKKDLELQEYVHLVMTDIGNLVEGLIKIHFIEYIAINRLSRGKRVEIADIKSIDLGVILNELIQTTNQPDLFTVASLKLSDWRNIAYHHNYRIIEQKIICSYGPKNNRKDIIISRSELWDILTQIAKVLEIFNLAHKLFFYDNQDEILADFDKSLIGGDGRTEIWFLTLSSAITAQGFEVIEFETDDDLTKITLREFLHNCDVKARAIHSSQFIYNLWYFSSSKKLIVEYRLQDNSPYLISSSTSDICEKIGNNEEDLSYLAKHVKFNFTGSR